MNKEELAKFFVGLPNWRWMPGMMGADTGLTLDDLTSDWESELPDLSDPATIGCIVQLVAEAHHCNLNDVSVVRTTGGVWSVWIHTSETESRRVATHLPSRVEALAMALQGGDETSCIREELAALEHQQWAHWTKYMLDTLSHILELGFIIGPGLHPDVVGVRECVQRWRRQIDTPYADLTEEEKASDREWADKVLNIVGK